LLVHWYYTCRIFCPNLLHFIALICIFFQILSHFFSFSCRVLLRSLMIVYFSQIRVDLARNDTISLNNKPFRHVYIISLNWMTDHSVMFIYYHWITNHSIMFRSTERLLWLAPRVKQRRLHATTHVEFHLLRTNQQLSIWHIRRAHEPLAHESLLPGSLSLMPTGPTRKHSNAMYLIQRSGYLTTCMRMNVISLIW